MRPLDLKTPGRGDGAGAWQSREAGNLKAKNNAHGPVACQCRINQGCLFCRRWDRTIRGIDARRADSLRRQSMGDLMRAGD